MNLIKICKSAKKSAGDLAVLSNPKRNKILEDLSKNLDERKEEIFNANKIDLKKNKTLSKEIKDRLIINDKKLKDIIRSIKNVKKLNDPLNGSEEYIRKDGLEIIKKVISKSKHLLKINGKLILEIGYDQKYKVSKFLKEKNFFINKIIKDYGNNVRCIVSTKINETI